MFCRISTGGILLTAILLIATGTARADYCVNFNSAIATMSMQHGGSDKASFRTKEECENYLQWSNSDYVHKNDLSGGCYPCGSGSASLPGMGGMGGKAGSTEAAIKQALVLGIVGGVLNAALNPPPPKKGANTVQPSAEALAQQQKYQQQLKAQEAAQQAAFSSNQQKLLSNLKGDVAQSKPNSIDLKLPSAAGQLSLLEREGHQAATGTDKDMRSDWENPPKNLPAAMTPKVPDVPAPVSAEDEIKKKHAQEMLKDLLSQISISRQKVDKLDQEVKQLEVAVQKEEQKAATAKKPDDDALRKAREALERAKQNREKTAAELRKLEDTAAQARQAMSSVTPAP